MLTNKETDFGSLPFDWEVLPLGDLVQSVAYGSSAMSKPTGTVPVLRMGNLQAGRIDWQDLVYTDDPAEIQRYTLRDGDVLFNRTNTIDLVGKTSIYEGGPTAIFAGYLIRIVARSEKIDARYLNYVMNTELARKHSAKVLSVAVGQANINAQKLRTYPIPVPPTLSEQRAIATALRSVEALVGKLEQLISKKRDIKQAAMQQLLTGQTRLPGFRQSWEVKRLGDLAEIVSGGTPKTTEPAYWDGGIKWCTPTDITGCTGKYLTATDRTISQLGLQRSGASLLPAGALLLCSRATVGEVRIARDGICTNQGFKSLVCRQSVSNEFLYYKLLTMKQKMVGRAFGSTFLEISKGNVAALEVDAPPLPEQAAIAEVLSDMDAELAALEARRDKTSGLKQAMMQDLLTGKTRLASTEKAHV